jgi:serine/threonine protein phosphatase PrpC
MSDRKDKRTLSTKQNLVKPKNILPVEKEKEETVKILQKRTSVSFSNADFFINKIIGNNSDVSKIKKPPTRRHSLQMPEIAEILFNNPLSLNTLKKDYDEYKLGDCSKQGFNNIKSYASNTYKGVIEDNNEDFISVDLKVQKPDNLDIKDFPQISYFSIFDGHKGSKFSKFLKENFLTFFLKNKNFTKDIRISLLSTLKIIEKQFNKKYNSNLNEKIEESGSCVLILLVVENQMYITNLGSSRAILSLNNGSKTKPLTIDHKPNNQKEYNRILENKGNVYYDDDEYTFKERNLNNIKLIKKFEDFDKYMIQNDFPVFRTFPYHLTYTRSLGDIKLKNEELGGKEGILISEPEIFILDLTNNEYDFIVMGSEGLFNNLNNKDVIEGCWFIIKNMRKERKNDIHLLSSDICNFLIKYAIEKGSEDNISCIFIGLNGFDKYLYNKHNKEKEGYKIKGSEMELKVKGK